MAVADDPDAAGAADGAFPAVVSALDSYAESTGFIKNVRDRLSQADHLDGQPDFLHAGQAGHPCRPAAAVHCSGQAMSRLKAQMSSLNGSTTISAF
jgi:hypothetical protein